MAIEMIPNSRLGQETRVLKADTELQEGKAEKGGEAVKAGETTAVAPESVTGKTSGELRIRQAKETAAPDQGTESGGGKVAVGSGVRRKAMDQYIPEEKAESFGHYGVVPDGKGNTKIQFDRPEQALEGKTEGKQRGDSSEGAVKKADSQGKDGDGKSGKIQRLKLKKKQLKEQIKTETDPGKAGELKRKLAKVERELKGKGGLTF